MELACLAKIDLEYIHATFDIKSCFQETTCVFYSGC